MDVDESLDPKELKITLETYKKLANDFANHDTILKVGNFSKFVYTLFL